ncbi:MAG: gliding motility-associated C-terminal domain-containing protein, partial [Patiriisocius sp.]|uniref:T9SS type B sorting domain-containing protein n=1 Tax=Patiriisocius sp. TaxID=2822396 RepID=UPI003EF1BE94
TQEFCAIDNPTIADLQTNEPNITWYDAPNGGNAYAPSDPLMDGQNYYASQTIAGCESSVRLMVMVEIFSSSDPTISSNGGDAICLNTIIEYTTETGNTNYIWSFTGGEIINGGGTNDNFIEIEWTELNNTSVSVSYDSVSGCGSGATTTFNEIVEVCADIIISKVVNEDEPNVGEIVTFTISVENLGPSDFFDLEISEQIPSGYTISEFETSIGIYDPTTGIWSIDVLAANETAILTLKAEVLGTGDYLNTAFIISSTPFDSDPSNNSSEVTVFPSCLKVYNEFSPNSDGINDLFVVSCIEKFPNNTLQIFNRYGSLVYKKNRYDNSWDGCANVNGVANKDEVLPSDTYYYVLDLKDNKDPLVGWIFIVK